MKTGRPPKEETPYKVIIHKNGGRRYASTKIVISLAGGKKEYRHKHWGYIDKENKFHPNDAFTLTPATERDKLIFPEGIDLTEIAGVTSISNATVIYQPGDMDRQYGATWFMNKVAEVTGVKEDLRKVFHPKKEDEEDEEEKIKADILINEILTLAFFPYLENLAYSQLEQWQDEVYTPTQVRMTPKRITLVTKAISVQNREDLFECRSLRVDKDELCAVDSTSISTYGCHLVDIRFGKNKEKLPLAQTVEVVVYSLTSHLPVFYMELPGNMPDSRTMQMILERLAKAGFKNLIIITDRGYESLKNIQLCISKEQKILTSVKAGQGDVLKRIKSIDLSAGIPSGMSFDVDSELFYAQYNSTYSFKNDKGEAVKAKDFKINLYFSLTRRAQALQDLTKKIENQINRAQKILIDKEVVKSKTTLARELDYLKLEIESKELKSFSVNEKKRKKSLETAGFFASKTIGLNYDPLEAMHKYSLRDEQEKCFQKQKSPLHQDRLRCWTEASKHGRMFIIFISLILTCYISYVWSQNEYLRKKFRTSEDIVRSFRTIRCFERDGHIVFISPFVGDQVEICKAFGFEIPKGCAPASYYYPTPKDDK